MTSLSPAAAASVGAVSSRSSSISRETSPPEPRTPSGFEFLDFGDDPQSMPGVRRCFDWEIHGAASPHDLELTHAGKQRFKRRLGPTEVSYYLGSRGEGVDGGVNDMYLHIRFRAKSHLMKPERLLSVWTEITLRHQLLVSSIEYQNVHEIRFVYEPPKKVAEARARAKSLMEIRVGQDPKALVDEYLNGPRTLSDERLSYLIFSTPEPSLDAQNEQEYDVYLLSTHFLGDGMALHCTACEIFALLADAAPAGADPSLHGSSSNNIESVLKEQEEYAIFPETGDVYGDNDDEGATVPAYPVEKLAQAMEAKLVTPEGWGRMAWAGARVEYIRNQAKLIGGQTFARAKLGERKTLVPTIAYDSVKSKKILASCKAHGMTIAHTVFALTNLAYIRATPNLDERLPLMIYSALNMRGNLKGEGDFFHIAIGYYNIILPSFLPSTISAERAFWHRALDVRQQTSAVVKSKWLALRCKLMALERERRSIGFEREDEDERRRQEKESVNGLAGALSGLGIMLDGEKPSPIIHQQSVIAAPSIAAPEPEPRKEKHAPSAALMGLSMLGNLDAIYPHKSYHGMQLDTLTTGSRQRPGAILLFAYTFAGKFWLSLGYDSNGFKRGVIESWWTEVQNGVDEFLLRA